MHKAIAALIVFAFYSSARAADLPAPILAPSIDQTVEFRWSGFYAGINSGLVWGNSGWNAPGASTEKFDLSGFSLGGTIGYNYQIDRAIVGVEGDIAWSNFHGSTNANCLPGCETKTNWLSTIRGRVGYGVDRFLPFVTGGIAFADVNASSPGRLGSTKIATGWAAGFGVEYALTDNWTAKAEYIFADFGNVGCGENCSIGAPVNVSLTEQQVRFGLTYKFFAAEPPVQTAGIGPNYRCKPRDPTDPGPHCDIMVAKKEHKKQLKGPKQQVMVNSSMKQ